MDDYLLKYRYLVINLYLFTYNILDYFVIQVIVLCYNISNVVFVRDEIKIMDFSTINTLWKMDMK